MYPLILAACIAAVSAPGPAPREEPMTLHTATGEIYGTLALPTEGAGPWPVALIIAGSGPTDRDGNSPAGVRTDAYRLLADSLAARGIATLRYDKRGIAASRAAGPQETKLRFDDYVDDAAAWLRQLRADKRFSTVAVIGHSEGSLIGMIAARTAGADVYVSLEGAGFPAADILRTQLKDKLPPELLAQSDRILSGLEKGQTTDSVPPQLVMLYRVTVQPYLISWFRYDPAVELAKLTIPALIVQGAHDVQVGLDDANRLAGADPRATLLVLPDMMHMLKDAPAGLTAQQAAYTDPSLPLDPNLVTQIAAFVLGAKR
jgi:uncharacterized protein